MNMYAQALLYSHLIQVQASMMPWARPRFLKRWRWGRRLLPPAHIRCAHILLMERMDYSWKRGMLKKCTPQSKNFLMIKNCGIGFATPPPLFGYKTSTPKKTQEDLVI